MRTLPPSASTATPLEGARIFAPSAARNRAAIVDLLRDVAPAKGRALELASGTGQHITALAAALPDIEWHPSEIAAERIASINAYATDTGLRNLHPAVFLDAATHGWATSQGPFDLIHLGNLLHLIPQDAARALLTEAAQALAPSGTFVIYGPFLRAGRLVSDGDRQFDAELRAADPAIGYKDDTWVKGLLTDAGLHPTVRDMPANNLAFIAKRSR
jgi:SAM-dependent methyltransferase